MEVRLIPCIKQMKLIALAPVLSVLSLSVHADPVVWHLNGVTFDDGGTASGTFTYDADTNAYSDIAISTTAGGARNAASYNALNPGYVSFAETLVVVSSADGPDFLGDPVFYPVFNSPLTNSGGTVIFALLDSEASCMDATCSTAMQPRRNITGGGVSADTPPPAVTQQIPTMSVHGLLLTVIGLFAIAGRRLPKMQRGSGAPR